MEELYIVTLSIFLLRYFKQFILPCHADSGTYISFSRNHTLKVWITTSGDSNHANDTITKSLVALSNYVDGNVLVELLTGIWCPNCPPADAFIDQLDLNPRAVVATFHGGDILDIPEGQTYMENYFPSSTHYILPV